MSHFKSSIILTILCFAVISACTAQEKTTSIPSDFLFVLDARRAKDDMGGNIHVNIKIDARGKGQFEYYDTGSSIRYDLNKIVTYDASQVVKSGKFRFTEEKLGQLWELLNKNHFFDLEEYLQMEIGYSFAFIRVEANGKSHMVNNIGMEVPEIRAIVEGIGTILPEEITLEYGKGFTP
jgi:hypothetical protein